MNIFNRVMRTTQVTIAVALGSVIVGQGLISASARAAEPADLQVCQWVARGGRSGIERPLVLSPSRDPETLDDYLVKSAYFDIDGDGVPEHLFVTDESTAHIRNPAIERNDGTQVGIRGGIDEDTDKDWRWTADSRWLIYAGTAYVLRFAGWGTGYPVYLSRLARDFSEIPICKFETDVRALLYALGTDDPDVCSAVAAGKVSYLPLRKLPEFVPTDRESPGGRTYITGKVVGDFANDHVSRTAYLYEMSSGAGAGCELKYFDAQASDTSSQFHVNLTKLQDIDLSDAYPRRTCSDDVPRWFVFEGKTYLESGAVDAGKPRSAQDEFHRIDSIARGTPRRVCKTLYTKTWRIVGVWAGSRWAAPAGDVPTGAETGQP